MSNLEAMDHRLTFDDILEAVQDSKRGRWFLKEFETRLQKQDTTSILTAISKLEQRMDGLGAQAGQPEELVKVKAAIANARNDLLKMGIGKEALSAEGQMFANLADMARKAMPTTTHESAGVVRTLQLVAEIEHTIVPNASEDRAAKYFKADENLFERNAAPAKPILVATVPDAPVEAPKPAPVARKEEAISTGAKLTIRKSSAAEDTAIAAPPPEAEAAMEIAPPQPVVAQTSDIAAIDSPRIVVIRRKPEDMPNVEVEEVAAAVG
jgi:hypothetical protein